MMLLFHRRRSTVESLAIYTEHNFSFYVCCCLVAEITLCGVCAMGEWLFFYLFFSFFSFLLLLYYFHAQTCIHNANAYIIPFFFCCLHTEQWTTLHNTFGGIMFPCETCFEGITSTVHIRTTHAKHAQQPGLAKNGWLVCVCARSLLVQCHHRTRSPAYYVMPLCTQNFNAMPCDAMRHTHTQCVCFAPGFAISNGRLRSGWRQWRPAISATTGEKKTEKMSRPSTTNGQIGWMRLM